MQGSATLVDGTCHTLPCGSTREVVQSWDQRWQRLELKMIFPGPANDSQGVGSQRFLIRVHVHGRAGVGPVFSGSSRRVTSVVVTDGCFRLVISPHRQWDVRSFREHGWQSVLSSVVV